MGEPAQIPERRRIVRTVVDAQVHVRVRVCLPARPRTAERDGDDSGHVAQPSGYLLRQPNRRIHSLASESLPCICASTHSNPLRPERFFLCKTLGLDADRSILVWGGMCLGPYRRFCLCTDYLPDARGVPDSYPHRLGCRLEALAQDDAWTFSSRSSPRWSQCQWKYAKKERLPTIKDLDETGVKTVLTSTIRFQTRPLKYSDSLDFYLQPW